MMMSVTRMLEAPPAKRQNTQRRARRVRVCANTTHGKQEDAAPFYTYIAGWCERDPVWPLTDGFETAACAHGKRRVSAPCSRDVD